MTFQRNSAAATDSNKRRKKFLIFAAVAVPVLLIGGVFAATTITVNGNNQVQLGAGFAAVTTCDSAVNISSSQTLDATTGKYVVSTISVTGIDGASCGTKTLNLAATLTSGGPYYASWTLPTPSVSGNNYIYGSATWGLSSGTSYYQTGSVLSSFDASILSTIAISIS